MKSSVPSPRIRNLRVAFMLCSFSLTLSLFPAALRAQSDYYRHVFFDNSLTHDTYYFSSAQSNGQSFIEQQKDRLPVDSEHFRTPPNAIRL